MYEETLAQIDLTRYREVLTRLLGRSATLVIALDQECVNRLGDQAESVITQLNAASNTWETQAAPMAYVTDALTILVFGIHDHHDKRVAHALVSYPRIDDPADTVIALTSPLVECIESELRLADELHAMAEELTARYEELNLVYDTQDQATGFEETQSQLKLLVENCLEYLNVGFAALILRDKKLMLHSVDSTLDTSDVVLALEELQGQLYDWVSATQQTAVINDVNDQLAAVLCGGVPFRLVASPVLSGSKSNGVLITGRTYSQGKFTNNDKNLLDVMSRKASKIVLATYDSLTGLVKRSGFEFQIAKALQSTKIAGEQHSVFVIDVDRMQVINDTLGYEAGDMVITRLAALFQETVRAGDTVARISGDEFGVILPNCQPEVAKKIALKFAESVEALELQFNNNSLDLSVSVGVTPVLSEQVSVDAVIAAAEVACSSIKDRGGNGVSFYRSGDEELVRRKSYMDLVARIQDTLRSNRFELFCQSIAPLLSDTTAPHGEVLLRMLDEADELISPALFLPAAERYHLMPAIDRWVVGKTISMIEQSGLMTPDFHAMICINLSGQTLSDHSFIDYLERVLDETHVPAANLCFEITETTAINDIDQAERFITAIKQRGVRFALDDFGTGLSSFSYLKQLPVDYLKIDGSFVKDICSDPVARTMVEAINKVGHTMGLQTIGEFVENDEIIQALTEVGVDYGQGYGIAKPIPLLEYLASLGASPAKRKTG